MPKIQYVWCHLETGLPLHSLCTREHWQVYLWQRPTLGSQKKSSFHTGHKTRVAWHKVLCSIHPTTPPSSMCGLFLLFILHNLMHLTHSDQGSIYDELGVRTGCDVRWLSVADIHINIRINCNNCGDPLITFYQTPISNALIPAKVKAFSSHLYIHRWYSPLSRDWKQDC